MWSRAAEASGLPDTPQNSALVTRRFWAASGVLLTAFLLWLLNHPYQGIWHDARVYGLIAAYWIHPQALAHDLFFQFGSQGSLSLFTPIYGELVRALGLDLAARLVVLSGGAFWCVALFALSRAVLGDTLAGRFAVLFGVVLSVSYSPNTSIFVLNENFATARSWAMPSGLLAVALLAQGRVWWAGALALFSCLLHPLLGIWPLALVIGMRLSSRQLAVCVCLPTLLVLVIGCLGGLDVAGLGLLDGALLDYVQTAPDIVFKPDKSRLLQHLLPLLILLLGMRQGSPHLRPLYARLCLIAGGALLLAWVASVRYPVELVVQGQPWRVTWLTLPIAGMALLDVLQALHRSSPAPFAVPWLGGVLLALVELGLLDTPWAWLGFGVVMLAASFLPAHFWKDFADRLQRWKPLAWMILAVLWAWALPGIWIDLEITGARFVGSWWNGALPLHGLVAGGLGWLPLLLAFLLGPLFRWPGGGRWGSILLIVLIVIIMARWDWRRESQRVEEARWLQPRAVAHPAAAHPFARLIRPGDTTAWPEKEMTVWFVLHAANYVGEVQHIGVVFSREKFAEWQRRDALMRQITRQNDTRLALCADPVVDWVVAPRPVPRVAPQATAADGALYACAPLRAVSPSAMAK